MKQSEYIPISVREKIMDKDISKVMDYLERNAKDFEFTIGYNSDVYGCELENHIVRIYNKEEVIIVHREGRDTFFLQCPTKLLADNIVGIWGSLKHY